MIPVSDSDLPGQSDEPSMQEMSSAEQQLQYYMDTQEDENQMNADAIQ